MVWKAAITYFCKNHEEKDPFWEREVLKWWFCFGSWNLSFFTSRTLHSQQTGRAKGRYHKTCEYLIQRSIKMCLFFINRPHIKEIWRIVYGSFSRSLKQCMMRFRPNLLLFSPRPSILEADGSTLVTQREKTIGRSITQPQWSQKCRPQQN